MVTSFSIVCNVYEIYSLRRGTHPRSLSRKVGNSSVLGFRYRTHCKHCRRMARAMRRCRRIAARFITLACSTQISISFRFPPMSAVRRSFGRKLRSADDVDSFSLGLLAILTSFRRSLFLLLYDQRATINAIVQLFLPKCLRIIDNITFFPDGHVFCRFTFFLLNRSWGKVDRLESSQ